MNAVDAAIVLVIISFTLTGVFRGFVWELAIFCTLLCGLAAGFALYYPVGMLIDVFMGNPLASKVIAFFLAFGTVSVVFRVVASYFKAKIKQRKWEKADRQLGGVFGFLEALVLVTFITTGVALYSERPQAIKESFLGRRFAIAGCLLIPGGVAQRVYPWLRDLTKRIETEDGGGAGAPASRPEPGPAAGRGGGP